MTIPINLYKKKKRILIYLYKYTPILSLLSRKKSTILKFILVSFTFFSHSRSVLCLLFRPLTAERAKWTSSQHTWSAIPDFFLPLSSILLFFGKTTTNFDKYFYFNLIFNCFFYLFLIKNDGQFMTLMNKDKLWDSSWFHFKVTCLYTPATSF